MSGDTGLVRVLRSRNTGARSPLAVGLALLALIIAGCTANPAAQPSATSQATASPQPPIVIGASLSLTGSYATEAIGANAAYELWAKTLNSKGGLLGRQVQLKVYDDTSDPAQATRLYEKLITEDKVDLLIGPFSSAVTAPVANVVEKYNFPAVLGLAGADAIYSQGFKNVFMVAGKGSESWRGYWEIFKQLGIKTIALTGEDSEYNRTQYPIFVQQAKDAGFTIVAQDLFPPNTSTVTSIIAKFKTLNPDVLMDGTYDYDATLLTRESKAQNFNPKVYAYVAGPVKQSWIDGLGKDAEFLCGEESWDTTLKTPGNADFVAAYTAQVGHAPDYVGALAYASGQVLQAAVEKAGSLDKNKVRDALATVLVHHVAGDYQVGPGGIQLLGGHFITQVQGGKPVVIWPSENAGAKWRLPVPAWNQR